MLTFQGVYMVHLCDFGLISTLWPYGQTWEVDSVTRCTMPGACATQVLLSCVALASRISVEQP